MFFSSCSVGARSGYHAGFREQRFQQRRGIFQHDAFFGEHLSHRSQEGIRVSRAQREQELGQFPVRFDAREDLLVLDLSGHDGAVHAFALESLSKLRQLAQ